MECGCFAFLLGDVFLLEFVFKLISPHRWHACHNAKVRGGPRAVRSALALATNVLKFWLGIFHFVKSRHCHWMALIFWRAWRLSQRRRRAMWGRRCLCFFLAASNIIIYTHVYTRIYIYIYICIYIYININVYLGLQKYILFWSSFLGPPDSNFRSFCKKVFEFILAFRHAPLCTLPAHYKHLFFHSSLPSQDLSGIVPNGYALAMPSPTPFCSSSVIYWWFGKLA